MYIFVRKNCAHDKVVITGASAYSSAKSTFLDEVGESCDSDIPLGTAIAGIDVFQTAQVNGMMESESFAWSDSAICCLVWEIKPR